MHFLIRPASFNDTTDIAAIYAHHVRTGTGTFEIEPPDVDEMKARMGKIAARRTPWLVAVNAQTEIIGFAYAGPFRERAAYDGTVEDSVYVAPHAQGLGVGRALLSALIEACQGLGAQQMLAVIGDSANHSSIGLHRSLGFEDAGLLRGVGVKFGRTLDVVILQRAL